MFDNDIQELELSVRAYNCLIRAGYRTIEEVNHLTYNDLIKIRNMGVKASKEILEKVEKWQKEHPAQEEEKEILLTDNIELNLNIDKEKFKTAIFNKLIDNISYEYKSFYMDRIIKEVIKEIIYEQKDIIIEKIIERSSTELIKKALPRLIEKMQNQ